MRRQVALLLKVALFCAAFVSVRTQGGHVSCIARQEAEAKFILG